MMTLDNEKPGLQMVRNNNLNDINEFMSHSSQAQQIVARHRSNIKNIIANTGSKQNLQQLDGGDYRINS